MRILAGVRDEGLRAALAEASRRLGAEVIETSDPIVPAALDALRAQPDIVFLEMDPATDLERIRIEARRSGAAVVLACHDLHECELATLLNADEWVLMPLDPKELKVRLAAAHQRAEGTRIPRDTSEAADLIRYQELLYDRLTGFPTLPVMIDRARELLEHRGQLTVLYINFVWYSKIEEIYGWQKLDDVLESTAAAVREFYDEEHGRAEHLLMVSHTADDDFILFTEIPPIPDKAEQRVTSLTRRLQALLRDRIEQHHGEDIADLCGIYIGSATIFRNPKIRTERLLYRGLREATQAARGAEEWERSRKVADLKHTLREGAVFMEYHQILDTQTEEVYGYEALARGVRREFRSPEVLFEVAEEANLIWELSRLLRKRAVAGIMDRLGEHQYLFLNVDPHDFDDPSFRNMTPADLGITDPSRIVLEITERVAIKDYARFQEHLAAFREQGFRFAVDDAGSGYAGLGSIANLAPDYIKLDISLISNIDTNFLKQNLVETMVQFANNQGAKVIAEGLERREEFETVRELGVHLSQGFLFHRPQYSGLPHAAPQPRSA